MTRPEDTAIGVQMAASKRRRARIGTAVGVLAVLLAVAGALWFFSGGAESFYDVSARAGQAPTKTPEEIQAELNRVVEEGMFNISIASTVDFASPGSSGTANIENVPGNRYDMKVSITLDDTGETVYESGGIAPGDYIPEIELTRALETGAHDATATFFAYDRETHEQVGSAAARVVLAVGSAS